MIENAISLYSGLSLLEKPKFISLLGFYLTTIARSGYTEAGNDTETAVRKLRGFNEMLQTCLKQQLSLLGESVNAYPDKEFFLLLERHAIQCACQTEAYWALQQSIERFQ